MRHKVTVFVNIVKLEYDTQFVTPCLQWEFNFIVLQCGECTQARYVYSLSRNINCVG